MKYGTDVKFNHISPVSDSESCSRSEMQPDQDFLIPQHCQISVVDPDSQDPYFGPPRSGSVIICTDPDPSINKQKTKKNLGFLTFDLKRLM
jgi:hypothetical protein